MNLGNIYALIAAFLLGAGVVLLKFLNSNLSPLMISTYSILLGFILMTIHILITKQNDFKKFSLKKHGLGFVFLGPLGTGLALFLAITGLQKVNASTGGFLIQLDIVACIILGVILLKEKIKLNHWIGICLTLIGALSLSIDFSNINEISFSTSSICVAVGGFLFGVAIIGNRLMNEEFNALELTWLRLAGALPVLMISSFIAYKDINIIISSIKLLDIWWMVYAVSNFYLAYILLAKASKLIESWKIGAILKLIPFFTLFLSFILLNEELNLILILGSLFIISGILVIDIELFMKIFKKNNND
ncbi:DMT family transporter [Tepidibacter formicigenes]|jgi:drug/metabolite transporter (DMT)-like permease|uniref:Uncharacterized membrane protein n=1 Tax=Tepidibacter formicigenes DSM 15518 TaxID=1123349 RepID=A0A1M6SXC7_9FIRM|nr:DMT family transporter [Tepidibacter formicigenes]SHK49382.1 Uncharacterized membrane protein [Tepidibacter formicigenes DSM 15518]